MSDSLERCHSRSGFDPVARAKDAHHNREYLNLRRGCQTLRQLPSGPQWRSVVREPPARAELSLALDRGPRSSYGVSRTPSRLPLDSASVPGGGPYRATTKEKL